MVNIMKLNSFGKNALVLITFFLLMAISVYAYIEYIQCKFKSVTSNAELISQDFVKQINYTQKRDWILVKLRINNSSKEYDFIFDTGAQVTMFSPELVTELDLDVTTFSGSKSDSEAVPVMLIVADEVHLGDIKFVDVGGMAVDFSKMGNLDCIGVHDIIGRNFIEQAVFRIDYQNKSMLISDDLNKLPAVGKAQLFTYPDTKVGTPLIPSKINNYSSIDLTVDTGFSGFVDVSSKELFNQIEQSNDVKSRLKKVAPYKSFKNISARDELKVKTELIIGNINVGPVFLDIDKEETAKNKSSGLLGNQFLENFVVTINFGERQFFLEQHTKFVSNSNPSPFGMSIGPQDNKIIVRTLYHQSVAALSGIQIGDEIIRINQHDLQNLSTKKSCNIFLGKLQLIDDNAAMLQLDILRDVEEYNFTLKRENLFK